MLEKLSDKDHPDFRKYLIGKLPPNSEITSYLGNRWYQVRILGDYYCCTIYPECTHVTFLPKE